MTDNTKGFSEIYDGEMGNHNGGEPNGLGCHQRDGSSKISKAPSFNPTLLIAFRLHLLYFRQAA